MKKLLLIYVGLYRISRVNNNNTYEVTEMSGQNIRGKYNLTNYNRFILELIE